MKVLRRTNFVRWLRKQAPESIVGTPTESEVCPLACYMGASVYDTEMVFDGGRLTTLQPWAQEFIKRVDRNKKDITAAHALKLLGEVT